MAVAGPFEMSEPAFSGACWVIHCDGSAVPNPGRMGLGAVITAPDGAQQTLSVATHTTGCNNEAELRALMAALQALQGRQDQQQADAVLIHSDNSIVVAQLSRPGEPEVARLAPLFDEARELIGRFAHVQLRWIPRHRNAQADALARGALGLGPKVTTHGKGQRKRR